MAAHSLVTPPGTLPRVRLRLTLQGAVQGVGFRPWIFRLATSLDLAGSVRNTAQGVCIEVEGPADLVETFLLRIESEAPPLSMVTGLATAHMPPKGEAGFTIETSSNESSATAFILPDLATCPECLAEIFDPENRRYYYPFTTCTLCGPRFSIIEALPYDRTHTTMRRFSMCAACRREYRDPHDRRFHSQPNACPVCGPQVELWDPAGVSLGRTDQAIVKTARILRTGAIVAVKGIGGFHLLVDAQSDEAVLRLRLRKHREDKPLALMFPSVLAIKKYCHVDEFEERLLGSPAAPIVLLRAKNGFSRLPTSIAPQSPLLGCMVAYTPLHHLLLAEMGGPLVATSGNRSDEPICIDEQEALRCLGGIADAFLVHDRPIARPVDDSVVGVILGRETILRRARGFAPLPVTIPELPVPVLAFGTHQKNTVALGLESHGFVSQHLGELDSPQALGSMQRTLAELQHIHATKPRFAVTDAHPDYLSHRLARQAGIPVIKVQHHYAHVLSCMVDNELKPPVLGVAWDGSGFGSDGTLWGGEFLRITNRGFERISHLRPFLLPGGERAAREPRRSALGILFTIFDEEASALSSIATLAAYTPAELGALCSMLREQVNAPLTSSAGRLFDAIASLIGIRQRASYEGQAAMELEFAAERHPSRRCYPFTLERTLDWAPMIRSILNDLLLGISPSEISTVFHNTMADMIVAVARRAGEPTVALSGGCFQNRYLTEQTVARLRAEGFKPYWHHQIPPNDGGISVGQLLAASTVCA